jgi:hypothetical protein
VRVQGPQTDPPAEDRCPQTPSESNPTRTREVYFVFVQRLYMWHGRDPPPQLDHRILRSVIVLQPVVQSTQRLAEFAVRSALQRQIMSVGLVTTNILHTPVEGWDPVAGLGTPNFEVLEDLALSGTMNRSGLRREGSGYLRKTHQT